MGERFRVVPASAASRRLALGLELGFAALGAFLAFRVPLPVGLSAAPVTFAVAGLMFWTAHAMRHLTLVLTSQALRIQADLFGRTIQRSALRAGEARLLSLRSDSAHQPTLRTCGTGLPGYLTGWFRLRNREKALVFLTEWSRVVYVPTGQGFSLLVSADEPEEFLRALRS